MGSGSWDSRSFASYTTSTKGVSLDSTGSVSYSYTTTDQDIFKVRHLDSALDPKDVIRECRDSKEHPNTIPVIVGIDCTGSMGPAAVEVSKKLNVIMTDLYKDHKDIEFMVMGIGDLAYDSAPIQVSQFESDIRIAEQLDKIYFEHGGGTNMYESYTAAWFIGTRQCKLDCWKRGKKGIIITMGDEQLNPYLPLRELKEVTGQDLQAQIETKDLYEEAKDKYDIYHIHVNHGASSRWREGENLDSWGAVIGKDNVVASDVDGIAQQIVGFIDHSIQMNKTEETPVVSWGSTEAPTTEIPSPIEPLMSGNITW